MQKLTNYGWLVLGILSILVGTILLLTEGVAHSKFFIYYLCSGLFFFIWWRYRSGKKTGKSTPKKKSTSKSAK